MVVLDAELMVSITNDLEGQARENVEGFNSNFGVAGFLQCWSWFSRFLICGIGALVFNAGALAFLGKVKMVVKGVS